MRDWLTKEQGRFVLWLPVCMGAAVLAYLALRFEPWHWLGAGLAGVALFILGVTRRWYAPRFLLCPILAAGLGLVAIQWSTHQAPPLLTDLPAHAVIVVGRVAAVDRLPEGRRLTLADPVLDATRVARSVRVRLRASEPAQLATGDLVRVRAMLRPIAPPAFPGAWDQQRDAFFAGLGDSGYALGPVEPLERSVPGGLTRFMQWLARPVPTGSGPRSRVPPDRSRSES